MAPDSTQPDIALSVVYRVGSKDEGPHEVGMAHMLEHMLFQGSESFPDPMGQLRQLGAETNAVTSLDSTRYLARLPAGHEVLDLALRIEADRMTGGPTLSAPDLEVEKAVVRNELGRSATNDHIALQRSIYAAAFQWHGYGRSVIGPPTSIPQLDPGGLRRFYRQHYRPDNATVVIAGAIDPEVTKAMVWQTIGRAAPGAETAPRTTVREPQQQGERQVILRRRVSSPAIGVLHHGLAATDADYPALLALRDILTVGSGSRLHRALVTTGLATRIQSTSPATADPGVLYFVVDVAPGVTEAQVQAVLERELDALVTGRRAITEEEAERFRRAARAEPDASAVQTATRLSSYVGAGDWRLAVAIPPASAAISVADVNRVAQALLKPTNRTTGILVPTEQPDLPAWSEHAPSRDWIEPFVAAVPEPPAEQPFEFTLANIERAVERTRLPGGAQLVALVTPGTGSRVHVLLTLPIIGTRSDPTTAAAGSLVPALIMGAHQGDDGLPLVDDLARMGTELNISEGAGTLQARLVTTPERLAASLRHTLLALRQPRFSAQSFEQARRARVALVEHSLADPTQVAIGRGLEAMVDTSGTPGLARRIPSAAELGAVAALEVSDVEDLARRALRPRRAVLAVVGDFDPSALVEAIDLDWGATAAVDPPSPSDPLEPPSHDLHVDVPDSESGVVLLGQPITVPEDDPDHAALRIAAHVLGGPGSSRLGERLRQREGYSYEVGASFHGVGPTGWGPLMIFATTAPQDAAASLAALREETEAFVAQGVSARELEAAKRSIALMQSLLLRRPLGVCAKLSEAAQRGWTLEHEQQRAEQLEALTVEQVDDAIRRHLRVESMVAVVAADHARLAAEREGDR